MKFLRQTARRQYQNQSEEKESIVETEQDGRIAGTKQLLSPSRSFYNFTPFVLCAKSMEDIAINVFAGPLLSSLFRENTIKSTNTNTTSESMISKKQLTVTEGTILVAVPVVALILIYVLLRVIWKVPKSTELPQSRLPSYGSVPFVLPREESLEMMMHRPKASLVEEGEVAGNYEKHWYGTFDFAFMLGMIVYAGVMLLLTYFYEPKWLVDLHFWLMQLPKLGVMMVVSLIGGVLCRIFCDVNEKGYIITNKSSKFKANYTRKLQHFAAYMVPLVVRADYPGLIALAWADFFTMLGFLVLIKPIREHSKFFMLQFNSLDRPEDRPNTLKWIILGNIAPGMFILMFFKWLFGAHGALTFILVFITGIGDGLAEPVGITWGRHKYKAYSCFSRNKYIRSWEGSACVFMSGLVFPALQYAAFDNFRQVLLSMLILAPTMAYAEATAPHTMDTPVLMIGCGAILYAIVNLV